MTLTYVSCQSGILMLGSLYTKAASGKYLTNVTTLLSFRLEIVDAV